MAGPEFDPLLRLREEAQRVRGAIAEFDTTVNNKVSELYPQFLEGKSGDDFLESAILLGEVVRDVVGSRPLLEVQKRRLEWIIQIGELAEEGFFGDRGNEIFGKAQEALRESGILPEETTPVPQEPAIIVPTGIFATPPESDGGSVPPPPESKVPPVPPAPTETESPDQIEIFIAPIEDKGRQDRADVFQVLRERLRADVVLPDGQKLPDASPKRKELLNLLCLLPEETGVFKKSLIVATGNRGENALSMLRIDTNHYLETHDSNFRIENASFNRAIEALYYLEQTGVGVTVEPSAGNREALGIEADSSVQTSDSAATEGMVGDEEAVRKMEDLLQQNLAYLESRGSGAEETLLSRLPMIEADELERLNKYDRDEIERMAGRLPTSNLNVDFNKVPLRVVQLLRFAAAFWTGRLQNYNPELSEISYERLREVIRDYLHLETWYTRAYPWADNLPLLAIDLAQRVREQVSEKKSGSYS